MNRWMEAAIAAVICIVGCGPAQHDVDVVLGEGEALAGSAALGVIPSGLPSRLTVGLFEDTGNTWMKSSGVRWDVRYRYFTKGWVNNWGFGAYDGSWGLSYMNESSQAGFIPAVQYYQINGEPGGDETKFLAKVQNAATMKTYFGDFKILMQRAKDFGKPVLVLMEADGFGFLQQQTGGNPNAYAAVKDSGVPELAGLPNTVAGWGLAFLQLRKSVGASNVILGIHVSAWASGSDIAYFDVTSALGPAVDKVYNFLAPFGLASNVTGQTFDVLVGDPLDRDSDYYRLVVGQDRWWDASDAAPITSKSFNRYAEWLRLWNQKSSKRWVLWQIPLGNSNHADVCNNGSSRQGYKDNRAEYFFSSGTQHLAKFADDGVVSLLFGAGASCQSSYTNDTYSDGQLFMKSRAGAFLNAGGLPIAGGGASLPADPSPYHFEGTSQGWTTSGGMLASVASSPDRAFAGTASLKVNFSGGAGSQQAFVASPSTPAGRTLTFHVWFPSGSPVTAIQPFALQGAAGGWTWTGNWRPVSALAAGQWNTITVAVPTNAITPLAQIGVEFTTNATWTGAAYVDSVSW